MQLGWGSLCSAALGCPPSPACSPSCSSCSLWGSPMDPALPCASPNPPICVLSTGHRSKGTACALPPQPLQFLLALTSTCLLSWALNRSLHACANYSLIISAYQNTAFQLPFILLFACQVTSPSPRCRHCSRVTAFLNFTSSSFSILDFTPSAFSVLLPKLEETNPWQKTGWEQREPPDFLHSSRADPPAEQKQKGWQSALSVPFQAGEVHPGLKCFCRSYTEPNMQGVKGSQLSIPRILDALRWKKVAEEFYSQRKMTS